MPEDIHGSVDSGGLVSLTPAGPDAARQRRGGAVVAAVLEATRAELVRVGYVDLRIDEVARRAGVNKTTVYRRWPTRTDLVRDAVAETLAAVEPPTLTGQVSEDLRRHLHGLCALAESPVGVAMLAARVHEQADLEVERLMDSIRLIHEEVPRRILLRGVAEGQLRPDLDVNLVLAMVHGAIQHRLAQAPAGLEPAFIDQVITLICNGMLRLPLG